MYCKVKKHTLAKTEINQRDIMEATKYFYRNVIFSKKGDKIALIDLDNPDKIGKPLDRWLGLVLQLADGQHTVKELVPFLAQRYFEGSPDNLEKTIYSTVERLEFMQFIVLTDEKTVLPYYLSLPYEQLDIEKAKKLIEEDKESAS